MISPGSSPEAFGACTQPADETTDQISTIIARVAVKRNVPGEPPRVRLRQDRGILHPKPPAAAGSSGLFHAPPIR